VNGLPVARPEHPRYPGTGNNEDRCCVEGSRLWGAGGMGGIGARVLPGTQGPTLRCLLQILQLTGVFPRTDPDYQQQSVARSPV